MESRCVDKESEEILQKVVTAGILGTLAASIRALMVKNETIAQKLRNFVAGVFMSLLLGYILRDAKMQEMWKEVLIGIGAAFITTLWPELENGARRLFKKKIGDVVRDDDN